MKAPAAAIPTTNVAPIQNSRDTGTQAIGEVKTLCGRWWWPQCIGDTKVWNRCESNP